MEEKNFNISFNQKDIINILADQYIDGSVFFDKNCNGIREVGDIFLSGVLIQLFNISNTTLPFKFTSTDSNGYYKFSNLLSATYYIQATINSPFKFTIPNQGGNDTIDSDVDSNGRSALLQISTTIPSFTVDVGLCVCYKISGVTFYDCNKGSIITAKSALLPNVTVLLYNSSGQEITTTQSDEFGYYEFLNLCPGTYTSKYISPPEMTLVAQNNTFYGSKPIQLTGIATYTLTNSSILNGYAGFIGGVSQDLKYCKSCGNQYNFCSTCN